MTDKIDQLTIGSSSYDIDLPVDNVVRTNTVFNAPTLDTVAGSGTSGSYLSVRWYASGVVDGINNITTPYDGMKILVKIPLAGVSTAGVVLSINGNNNADYHPVAYNVNTAFTTHFPVGTYKILIYDSTQKMNCYITSNTKKSVTGVWKCESDYDSNTDTKVRQYQSGQDAAGTGTNYPILTRYNLTNKSGSYDATYARFYTDTYINTSNGYLYAPKVYSGGTEVLTGITSGDVTSALGYTPGTSNFTGYTSSNKLSTDYINNVANWSSFSGYTSSNKLDGAYINNTQNWTSNTGNVTGTGLTADQIVLGNGSSAIKISSYKPSASSTTWSTTSDVYLPTMKAISSYVTGLGYTTNTGTVIGSGLTADTIVLGNGTVNVKTSTYKPAPSSVSWSSTSDVYLPTMKSLSNYVWYKYTDTDEDIDYYVFNAPGSDYSVGISEYGFNVNYYTPSSSSFYKILEVQEGAFTYKSSGNVDSVITLANTSSGTLGKIGFNTDGRPYFISSKAKDELNNQYASGTLMRVPTSYYTVSKHLTSSTDRAGFPKTGGWYLLYYNDEDSSGQWMNLGLNYIGSDGETYWTQTTTRYASGTRYEYTFAIIPSTGNITCYRNGSVFNSGRLYIKKVQ